MKKRRPTIDRLTNLTLLLHALKDKNMCTLFNIILESSLTSTTNRYGFCDLGLYTVEVKTESWVLLES